MRKRARHLNSFFLLTVVFLFVIGFVSAHLVGDVFAQTRPALVKDVDNPARSAVLMRRWFTVPSGVVSSSGNAIGSVLADGYRLVIEYVSVECEKSGGVEAVKAFLTVSERPNPSTWNFHHYPIPLTNTKPSWDGSVSSVGTQSVRWYHDSGQAVSVGVALNGPAPSGGIGCVAYVSGYTVTLP